MRELLLHVERMLRQWETALAAYRVRRSRIRWDDYQHVIDAVLAELQKQQTVKALRERYERGNFWAVQIARRLYPTDKEMWDLHYTADVAYALRYEQLSQAMTPGTADTTEGEEAKNAQSCSGD